MLSLIFKQRSAKKPLFKTRLVLLPIALLDMFVLTGCSGKNDWTGFYYPDINTMADERTWVIQHGLKSLESCREWVNEVSTGNTRDFDYECGHACRYESGIKMTVCKETLQ